LAKGFRAANRWVGCSLAASGWAVIGPSAGAARIARIVPDAESAASSPVVRAGKVNEKNFQAVPSAD